MITAGDIPPLGTFQGAQASPHAMAEQMRHVRDQVAATRVAMLMLKEWSAPDGHGGYAPRDVAGFTPDVATFLERSAIAMRNLAFKLKEADAAAMKEAATGKIVAIRFLQAWGAYSPGDIAGFTDPALVRKLIAGGVAEAAEATSPVRRTLASIRDALLRQ